MLGNLEAVFFFEPCNEENMEILGQTQWLKGKSGNGDGRTAYNECIDVSKQYANTVPLLRKHFILK